MKYETRVYLNRLFVYQLVDIRWWPIATSHSSYSNSQDGDLCKFMQIYGMILRICRHSAPKMAAISQIKQSRDQPSISTADFQSDFSMFACIRHPKEQQQEQQPEETITRHLRLPRCNFPSIQYSNLISFIFIFIELNEKT